jgi:hypothetical protein
MEGSTPVSSPDAVDFDIWGCRGSRSLPLGRSAVGIRTSCYSVLAGDEVLVLDAGRGIGMLAEAMKREARFAAVRTVYVLIGHAHLDHWEGLKDVDWFWERDNGLAVELCGPREAIDVVRAGHREPAYVPLERLADGTVRSLTYRVLEAGVTASLGRFSIASHALHHYSGMGESRRHLETIGYCVSLAGGPRVAYISDHEPTPASDTQ